VRVRRRFEFEAAHELPKHPGKCRNLHGHSYGLVVTVERPVDAGSGMAIDFGELKRIVNSEVVEQLDHIHVNDVIENPTAENMARWIWTRLSGKLPGLIEIELHETRSCSVIYGGE
jgi:6-pyruvoyltetrahydropterin/6-carboxytetrahydropterin synthase